MPWTLATRLLRTASALHDGVIDYPQARLIAEATRVLTDDQTHEIEALILTKAGQQTLGQLRAAVARAVIAVGPGAAARRREEAQKDPRVRRWQEDAGTAALAGFGLRPTRYWRPTSASPPAHSPSVTPAWPVPWISCASAPTSTSSSARTLRPPPGPAPRIPPRPPPPATTRSASGGSPRVNVTVTLSTLLGLAAQPGSVAGFGTIDASLARKLADLAAAHPVSRWSVTVTDDDGQPIGHGHVPGQVPRFNDPGNARPRVLTVTIDPLARGSCDHRHQEPGYHPSRRLQHLITTRTPTCSAPGCQWPAARCDLDHTVPYDQGGRTCECGLAPLCRHHHRCKQSAGWRLDQPQPGVMTWTTPAGRRYITRPGFYP